MHFQGSKGAQETERYNLLLSGLIARTLSIIPLKCKFADIDEVSLIV
jgi:hypothetical protein